MFVTKNKLAFLLFLTATIWINVAHAQCTPTITVDGVLLNSNTEVTICPQATKTLVGPAQNVSSGAVYTYQWYYSASSNNQSNHTAIAGATNREYIASAVGYYSLRVFNSANTNCDTEWLTQSKTYRILNTSGVQLAALSSTNPTVWCPSEQTTYIQSAGQVNGSWQLNGVAIPGSSNIGFTLLNSLGTYTFTRTSSGCTTSASTTITAPTGTAPTITSNGTQICQFPSGSGFVWGSVVLTAPTGTGYTYVWKKDGSNISGATGSTYTTTGSSGGGTFTCAVSINGACLPISNAITVTAGGSGVASTITVTPTATSATICPDGSKLLTGNSGVSSYVWNLNGVPIPGATSQTYTASAAGAYTLSINNNGCTSTSANFTISLDPVAAQVLNVQNVTCNGLANGAISPMIAGYQVSLDGVTYSSSISNLTPGTYSNVYLKRTASGCTKVFPSVVITEPNPLTAVVVSSNETCAGGPGNISFTQVSGGKVRLHSMGHTILLLKMLTIVQ